MSANPLKIGLLLPQPQLYPACGESLVAGMRLYMARHGERLGGRLVEFYPESIGLGQGGVPSKASTLLLRDRVDLLVGLLHAGTAAETTAVCQQAQTFLINLNIGENMARFDELNPYRFELSLGLWRANWALGAWAAEHLGRRGYTALSFYESGYDAQHTFRDGFEAAGGEITGSYVSHIPPHPWHFQPILDFINDLKPDFVHASYTGQAAIDFLRSYAESGLAGSVPLLGTAYLASQQVCDQLGADALGIKTALGWNQQATNPEFIAFSQDYQAANNQSPDDFAMLGYDAAQLLDIGLTAAEGDARRLHDLGRGLAQAQWTSPRGRIRMEPRVQSSESPIYLREVQPNGGGVKNATLQELTGISETDHRFDLLRQSPRSGWTNPYLCV